MNTIKSSFFNEGGNSFPSDSLYWTPFFVRCTVIRCTTGDAFAATPATAMTTPGVAIRCGHNNEGLFWCDRLLALDSGSLSNPCSLFPSVVASFSAVVLLLLYCSFPFHCSCLLCYSFFSAAPLQQLFPLLHLCCSYLIYCSIIATSLQLPSLL